VCTANHDNNHIDSDDSGGLTADADPSCMTHQPQRQQAVSQHCSKPRTPPTTTTTATMMMLSKKESLTKVAKNCMKS